MKNEGIKIIFGTFGLIAWGFFLLWFFSFVLGW